MEAASDPISLIRLLAGSVDRYCDLEHAISNDRLESTWSCVIQIDAIACGQDYVALEGDPSDLLQSRVEEDLSPVRQLNVANRRILVEQLCKLARV